MSQSSQTSVDLGNDNSHTRKTRYLPTLFLTNLVHSVVEVCAPVDDSRRTANPTRSSRPPPRLSLRPWRFKQMSPRVNVIARHGRDEDHGPQPASIISW